jgi:hypothetical protein
MSISRKPIDARDVEADSALHRFVQGLGSLSIVLGLTELLWGGAICSLLGLDGYNWLIRLYGGGQILLGLSILHSRTTAIWLWLRVAIDALHLGTLFYAYTRDSLVYGYTPDPSDSTNVVIAFIAVLGLTAVDMYCALKVSREPRVRLAQ